MGGHMHLNLSMALLAVSGVLAGCTGTRPAESPAAVASEPARSTNWVCRGLVDRFLGLPGVAARSAPSPAPVVGRWWVRGCELRLTRGGAPKKELEVHLEGPAWYWVDFEGNDLELHQQVPFYLSADITGSVRFAYSGGVASLWFDPTREADVEVRASTDLELHGANAWGSLLRRIPLLPVRQMTADRLSERAASAFTAELARGLTVTYDLGKGQADMALRELRLGETPRRAFEDGASWVENDRLLLPGNATQVLGPLDPVPIDIDVVTERGPGIAYRALCTKDMPAHWQDVAAGKPQRIPDRKLVATGTITGSSARSVALGGGHCPYYLVISSATPETTVVALRLRERA